ncbi:MAG: hypothetical protein QOG29_1379, partial [Gaiellaceae bacterium]|nr:hypothetical protein [Gaiellaceae bacterium]
MTRGKQARSAAITSGALLLVLTFGAAASGMVGRSSAADAAPAVKSIVSKAVGGHAQLKIEFTESVNTRASAFILECPIGKVYASSLAPPITGDHFTLNTNNAGLSTGKSCRLTVLKTRVTDTDSNDPPDQMAQD